MCVGVGVGYNIYRLNYQKKSSDIIMYLEEVGAVGWGESRTHTNNNNHLLYSHTNKLRP